MEDFRLTAMRGAARTVARWREMWGDRDARALVAEHIINIEHLDMPEFRAAYLTAFGQ